MGMISFIGPKNTIGFFIKSNKIKGSVFFFSGFLCIIIGWYMFTLLGFLSQIYGLFLLFKSFLSTIFSFCSQLPVIGPILRSSPGLEKAVNRLSKSSKGSKKKYDKDEEV